MTKKILILLVVLAVPLAMVGTAAAGPPCAKNPNHADCVGEPPFSTTTTTTAPDDGPVGLTCAEAGAPPNARLVESTPTADGFTVVLGWKDHACVDVDSAAGHWNIDVDLGSADRVSMGIQDSVSPGDACWGGCSGDADATVTESGTFATSQWIPAATLDACGIGFTDGAETLTFSASTSVRKGATPVTITVHLPQP